MMLEVIATTIEDVIKINLSSANRIELCSGMEHGGLTPDIEFIKQSVEVSKIPIRVMIRNVYQSYSYDEEEIDLMCGQITKIKDLGIEGIVIGCNAGNTINLKQLEKICEVARPLKITYHRAFDRLENKQRALDELNALKIDTILTNFNIVTYEPDTLSKLDKYDLGNINLLIGGGINIDNISTVHEKVKNIHVGSCARFNNSYEEDINIETINLLISSCI